jgi:hypothetical protein
MAVKPAYELVPSTKAVIRKAIENKASTARQARKRSSCELVLRYSPVCEPIKCKPSPVNSLAREVYSVNVFIASNSEDDGGLSALAAMFKPDPAGVKK